MVTMAVWFAVTALESGMLTVALHVYNPEWKVRAEVTVSTMDFSTPPLISSSMTVIPETLSSTCTSLRYQLNCRGGMTLLGFAAVQLRLNVLNGEISVPE